MGVLFAYYVIAPFTINFFAGYQLSPSFHNIITMSNYYDTMNDLILGMGIVFQLPVLVYFLSRVGILTPALMREKRSYAIVIIPGDLSRYYTSRLAVYLAGSITFATAI